MRSTARLYSRREKSPDEKFQVKSKRAKKTPVFFKRLRTLVLLAMMIYILASFGGLQVKMNQVNGQISALEAEKSELLEVQQKLLKEKERLNDPLYIERRAREALGFIKPGEKILLPAEPGEAMPLKMDGIDDIRD